MGNDGPRGGHETQRNDARNILSVRGFALLVVALIAGGAAGVATGFALYATVGLIAGICGGIATFISASMAAALALDQILKREG